MRYVDHDPAAARHAAAVCRDRAHEYERIAGTVGTGVATVTWSGCERDRVTEEVWAVCDDLRREAWALRSTADLLEAAARAAEQREADLAAAARAAAAAASACRPTTQASTWGHAAGATPAPAQSGTTSVGVPGGVR